MSKKKRIKGPWSEKEIKHLRELFPTKTLIEVSDKLCRSYSGVYSKAREIGLSRRRRPVDWTNKEIQLIKKLYPTTSTWIVGNKLNRPLASVRRKAAELDLKKR